MTCVEKKQLARMINDFKQTMVPAAAVTTTASSIERVYPLLDFDNFARINLHIAKIVNALRRNFW